MSSASISEQSFRNKKLQFDYEDKFGNKLRQILTINDIKFTNVEFIKDECSDKPN